MIDDILFAAYVMGIIPSSILFSYVLGSDHLDFSDRAFNVFIGVFFGLFWPGTIFAYILAHIIARKISNG